MQMQAMVLEEFGGTLSAQARTVPDPGPGEVLVLYRPVSFPYTVQVIILS